MNKAHPKREIDWFPIGMTAAVTGFILLIGGLLTESAVENSHFKTDCVKAGGHIVKLDGGINDDPRVCITEDWKVVNVKPRGTFD